MRGQMWILACSAEKLSSLISSHTGCAAQFSGSSFLNKIVARYSLNNVYLGGGP